MKSDRITIIGYGFVGQAIYAVLSDLYDNIVIVDPKYTQNTIEQDSDYYIVCVGTPTVDGICDCSIVESVLKQITCDKPIMIKSTMLPDQIEKVCEDKRVCYSPEFLKAETAEEDFRSQKRLILSGEYKQKWVDLFLPVLRECKNVVFATPAEASMVKYVSNTFLALKVAYLNSIYDLCQLSGVNYNEVKEIIKLDDRIGTSHFNVPNNGERGFGGYCFPKDTEAFLTYSKSVGTNLDILETAIEYNNKVRSNS